MSQLPPETADKPLLGTTGLKGEDYKAIEKAARKSRDVELTDDLFFLLCDRLAQGEPLVKICADPSMPSRPQLFRRLYKDEKSRELYYASREMQMEAMAEEILELSDDNSQDCSIDDKGRRISNNDVVQRSRLKIDTRKFIMAKMAPKRFGEKNTTEITGDPNKPVAMTIVTGVPRGATSLVRGELPAPNVIEGEKITEGKVETS